MVCSAFIRFIVEKKRCVSLYFVGDRVCLCYFLFYFVFNKAYTYSPMICVCAMSWCWFRFIESPKLIHMWLLFCHFSEWMDGYANGQNGILYIFILWLYCNVCVCVCVCKVIRTEYGTTSSVTKGRSKRKKIMIAIIFNDEQSGNRTVWIGLTNGLTAKSNSEPFQIFECNYSYK